MRSKFRVYNGYGLPVTDFGGFRGYGTLSDDQKLSLLRQGFAQAPLPPSSSVKKTYTPADGSNFNKVAVEMMSTTGGINLVDLVGWIINGPGGYRWYIVNPTKILLLNSMWGQAAQPAPQSTPAYSPSPAPKNSDNFPSLAVTPTPHPATISSGDSAPTGTSWVFPAVVGGSVLVALAGVAFFALRK